MKKRIYNDPLTDPPSTWSNYGATKSTPSMSIELSNSPLPLVGQQSAFPNDDDPRLRYSSYAPQQVLQPYQFYRDPATSYSNHPTALPPINVSGDHPRDERWQPNPDGGVSAMNRIPETVSSPFLSCPSPPFPRHDSSHVTDFSVAESVSIVWSFIRSQYSVTDARSLRGREAQRFIDFIDRVGDPQLRHRDNPEHSHCVQVTALPGLNEKLRNQCLYLSYKLCKDREMLPTSCLLQQELIHAETLHCCGGFADVSEGEYLGRRVAIKDLRFGTRDATDRIFKVPNSSATKYFTMIHFINRISVGRL